MSTFAYVHSNKNASIAIPRMEPVDTGSDKSAITISIQSVYAAIEKHPDCARGIYAITGLSAVNLICASQYPDANDASYEDTIAVRKIFGDYIAGCDIDPLVINKYPRACAFKILDLLTADSNEGPICNTNDIENTFISIMEWAPSCRDIIPDYVKKIIVNKNMTPYDKIHRLKILANFM